MTMRQPFPWEASQAPERRPDTDPTVGRPAPETALEHAHPEVQLDVEAGLADKDPDRLRRGAQGAADAMFRESEARGWGLSADYCRSRVNRARAKGVQKRNRS